VAFFGALASIAGFFWFIYDKFSPAPSEILELIILLVVALILGALFYFSIRVRQENAALRRTAATIHKINHDYRDALSKMFGGNHPVTDEVARIQCERETLQAVCQSAARIFNSFTHADCMVTIKLIDRDTNGSLTCQTYVRSQLNCERDIYPSPPYEINTGRNTAFDEALRFSAGAISHFYSADLTEMAKSGRYRNQRDNWSEYYQSAMVVPIRYVNPQKAGRRDASDDIGFLSIDTLSKYRLNNEYHLHFLAAFADQMYNFMSLMRGGYKVLPIEVPVPAQS
jgi:hypothetical protein